MTHPTIEALSLSAAPPGRTKEMLSIVWLTVTRWWPLHRAGAFTAGRHDVCRACGGFNGPEGLRLVPVDPLYRDSIVILCLAADEGGQRR